MTLPVCYANEGGRRYSRSFLPYYAERRYLPSHEHTPAHAGRTPIMTEREPEGETNPPRKRIAVACMRCRKRKIRCSGDPGNGMPCNNCKNAGSEQCRFLRVSSEETRLRNDSNEFTYDLGSARTYQARGTVPTLGAVGAQYSPEGVPAVASSEILPYRSGGSAYSYAGKGYYGAVSWSPHGYEDGVDYGLQTLSTPTKYESGTSPALYLNLEPGYAYPSASATNLVRPAPPISSGELPNFSLSTVAASLPPQLHSPGKERVLPSPARALPSSGSYREGAYQGKVSSSAHGSPSISSIAEVPYMPYEGYTTSATLPSQSSSRAETYTSTARPSEVCASSRAPDPYAASDSIFSPAETSLRTQGSATELSYRYTDSHRDPGGGAGQLANGHVYTSLPPLTGGYLLGEVEERRVAGVSGLNAV